MFLELVAVVVAGFAGAGVALLARSVAPLPRWLIPVAAGAAMLATTISLEYTWFGRTANALPEGVEVAVTREDQAPWRPWTYLIPYVDGFVAVDRGGAMTHEAVPGQRLADLYVFGRWMPTRRIQAVFDCAEGRRADLLPDVTLTEDGRLEGARWLDTGLDDPVTRAACAGA